MSDQVYCNDCGCRNPNGLKNCSTCGCRLTNVRQNPVNSQSLRPVPMAVFDIDMTLLDNEQRYKDARRAGLLDKGGNPVTKRFETKGKAYKRVNDILFTRDNLQKDRVISGALAFANELVSQGYTIAYCTGRHIDYYEVTRRQLEEKGFPIMVGSQGSDLLFLRTRLERTSTFKARTVQMLNNEYDVRMFFDDDKENLSAVGTLGIPGLYQSISDYRKFFSIRDNPWYTDSDGELSWYADETDEGDPDAEMYTPESSADASGMGRTPLKEFYEETPEKTIQTKLISQNPHGGTHPTQLERFYQDLEEQEEERTRLIRPYTGSQEDFRWSNPPPKPRQKKMKNGKKRKEPAKSYVKRFMGSPKMIDEFPENGQRYAVCLTYVEKFYGKSGLDSVGARKNPEEYSEDYMVPRDIHRLGKAADSLESTYEEGQEVPEWWKSKLSVTTDQADNLADALEYVAQNPSDCPPATQSLELNTKNRNNAIQADYIRYGPLNLNDLRYYDDAATHWNTDVATAKKSKCSNCVAFDISPRMLDCMPGPVSEPIEDEEGYLGYCWMHHFKCHSARTCYTWAAGGPITENKVSMEWQDRAFSKSNPMPLMGLSVQVSGYRNTAGVFVMKGRKFLILQRSKKETSKHGLWELPGGRVEKGETPRQAAVIEAKEEAGLDVKLKANLGPHHDDKKKKTYHAYTGVSKKGQKVKLSEEHSDYKWVTPEEVLAMPKKMVSHHLLYFLKKEKDGVFKMSGSAYRAGVKKMLNEAARSNPPSDKIEKGKKLYKHMNGKSPEKVETRKIDMGDVWYQVGEGGCWQIGYMSGKETGNSNQKYTHTFNEETQDGDFPKLYATMPEKGKPMLIIQGGTWKIKTDDKGVAWIYD